MNTGTSETVTIKSSVNSIWSYKAGLALQTRRAIGKGGCMILDKEVGHVYLYMDYWM